MPPSLSCLAQYLPLLKDAVVTATGLVAAYVGLRGLSTWRRQLEGNTEYALAKNVLVSCYAVRSAIAAVRHPFMRYSQEPDLPAEKLKGLDARQKEWHSLAQEYQRRWKPLAEAVAKLESHMLEVEAVWGPSTRAKVEPITKLVSELLWSIEDHLEQRNPTGGAGPDDPSEAKARRMVLYSQHGKYPDEFKARLDLAVSEIEAELKPHVLRQHA